MIEIKNSVPQEPKVNELQQIPTTMKEYICDQLCRMPYITLNQNSMDSVCAECRIQEYANQVLEQYEKIKTFQHSQCAILPEKYSGIVRCDECEFRAHDKSTDVHWCRLSAGLDGILKPEDGCSRGKRRNQDAAT